MNRIECALKMARDGWPVFPLVPGGSSPYADEGVTFATTNPARIRAWFLQRPDMNYGVAATGALIVDVDNKNGKDGNAEFRQIMDKAPDTFTVKTPNDGWHFYFKGDGTDYGQAALSAGVDVRAFNGYCVGAGSTTGAGTYQIAKDVEALKIPAEISTRIKEIAPEQYTPREERQQPLGELDTDNAVAAGVEYLTNDAPAGGNMRNETGFRVACALKDLGLSPDKIGELLCEHWDVNLSPDFTEKALYELGKRAHKSGRNRPGVRSAENDFADVFDMLAPVNDIVEAVEAEITKDPGDEAPEEKYARLLAEAEAEFQPLPLHIAPEDVPKRRWFIQDVLSPGLLTGIVAPPGVGKSTFVLNMLAGLSVGDLSGLRMECPEGAKRSLFISLEDDETEQYSRAWAAFEAHGLDAQEGAKNVMIPTAKLARFILLERIKGNLTETEASAKLLVFCKQHDINVLVIDPWVEASEGDENSNAEVQRAVGIVRDLCRRCEMAGVIIHHSRKALSGALDAAGDGNIVRGAGALNAALRATFTLLRPSADEAAVHGLSVDEALGYFRFDRAKGSYSPPGRGTKYYKNVSVLRPCDREGGVVSAPAVIYTDMSEREEETRRHYAEAIMAAMHMLGVDKLTMKDAIAAVLDGPIAGGQHPAAIKKALEALFSGTGAYVDGEQLRLGKVGAATLFQLEAVSVPDYGTEAA